MSRIRISLALLVWTAIAVSVRGQDAKPAARLAAAHVDFQGDPLPEDAVARIGSIRLRHGHEATGVAFSPDGTMLASTGYDP